VLSTVLRCVVAKLVGPGMENPLVEFFNFPIPVTIFLFLVVVIFSPLFSDVSDFSLVSMAGYPIRIEYSPTCMVSRIGV
jgi:hypothetical protein